MKEQSDLRAMRLDHALFELNAAAPSNARAIDRMVVSIIAGGAALVAGPAGVGKSRAAAAVADVFGIRSHTSVVTAATVAVSPAPDGELAIVEDLDLASADVQNALAEAIQDDGSGLLVGTVTTDPSCGGFASYSGLASNGLAGLTRRLRDAALMCIEVPYLEPGEERFLVQHSLLPRARVDRILNGSDLTEMRSAAEALAADHDAIDYAVRLVNATRTPSEYGLNSLDGMATGASPRASIALVKAARALALVRGSARVTTQHVFDVAYEVLVHRIEPVASAVAARIGPGDILVELLSRIPAHGALDRG